MEETNAFVSKLFNLDGKRVLLTGASSGLGLHFASTLARAGAHVILASRSVDKLNELASAIRADGGSCEVYGLDVRSRDAIRTCIERLESEAPVDVLVNNAGIAIVKAPQHLSDDDWDAVYETNLRGAWVLSQGLIKRRLADGRECSIVNIASVLGLRGIGHVAPYAAAKAGLINVGRDLSTDLAEKGIRINAIAPGYVETEMNREWLKTEGGERLRAKIPARRFGQPSDLDGALLYFASDASRYTNAAVVTIDGGFSAAL
ncbi:MAG: SDR family NAD(P)-dependent oxidoreductase [Gammaproteobacteria bacterium]|jgi:NAD(P)-dependent dehydrogenase (short-subunit alcohol dehydrogenase family)